MFKHFMVSAIYASSLDVLVTSGAAKLTRQHWWNLLDFFGTSQSHCAQASATVLSQVNLSLEGATWSFLKYHSKFGLYGVNVRVERASSGGQRGRQKLLQPLQHRHQR